MTRKGPGPIHPDWLREHAFTANQPTTDFPAVATSRDGQLHYGSEPFGSNDKVWSSFDAAYDKWLSIANYEAKGIAFGNLTGSATPTAANSFWIDYQGAALIKFGANVGWPAPYDLQLVSMAAHAVGASTATVTLAVNNATHANSTLTLTAVNAAQASLFTASATIAQGSYIGFYCSSGTFISGTVSAEFRRVMHE